MTEQLQKNIDNEKINIRDKDIKFYHVDDFVIFFQHCHKLSNKCQTCKKLSEEIFEISNQLSEIINYQQGKKADHLHSKISKHFRYAHQLYPKNYFAAKYTLFFLVMNTLLGILLKYSFFKDNWNVVLIFAAIGLVSGQMFGSLTDRKTKKENRQL